MKITGSEKLKNFFLLFSGEHHVLVLINADPDSIASAMAVKRLLWRRVAGVTIAHVNIVKRPDNVAMIRLLGLKLAFVDEIDPKKFERTVMVDSQPNHHDAFKRFTPHVIIDHHPESGVKAAYTDIRPKYGATATIMTEYLRAARIKPSAKLASALLHAIKTDTSNFERQTLIEDLKAFQYLFRHANTQFARRIEQTDLRIDFLKYFKIALSGMRLRGRRVFAHLGPVVHADVCVLIADFFMRIASIDWSIVSGICEDKLVVVVRNDGIRKNAGELVKKSFGHLGSAGGHKGMSRAEIPVKNLNRRVALDDDRETARWIVRQIEKSVKAPGPGKALMRKSDLGLTS
jgi:nanoRNase/pAp phosphatase (c-di-AMP/oligoRNAs hydrolase)